jgi:hypothetical protein
MILGCEVLLAKIENFHKENPVPSLVGLGPRQNSLFIHALLFLGRGLLPHELAMTKLAIRVPLKMGGGYYFDIDELSIR